MDSLELVLFLLVAVLIVVEFATKAGLAYPILLVIGGLLLAFVPGLPTVALQPDLVLILFLPPLLFIAAYVTPIRDLRANRGPILQLSVGLVLFTTLIVGVVANAIIPGLGLAGAIALGAIISPTDALAATTIIRRLRVPRRLITILEGESLLNDAAALVTYRAAVVAAASATGTVVLSDLLLKFVVAAAGGVVLGAVVGFAFVSIYRRLENPPVEIALSLVIPYAAYLPAESLQLSGVLSAVTAGLILGRASARIFSPETRVLGLGTWQMLTLILNGFAFILVGLQLRVVIADLPNDDQAIWAAVLISATVVLSRFVWIVPTSALATALGHLRRRHPDEKTVRPSGGALTIVSWAGLRGSVSLAAALALPLAFPQRTVVLFVTFTVILVTLVGQGLTLPFVVRHVNLAEGGEEAREWQLARSTAIAAGLDEVQRQRAAWPTHGPLMDRLESSLDDRARHNRAIDLAEGDAAIQERLEHQEIQHAVIDGERQAVIELRDSGQINDQILRRIERELDLESLRAEG